MRCKVSEKVKELRVVRTELDISHRNIMSSGVVKSSLEPASMDECSSMFSFSKVFSELLG